MVIPNSVTGIDNFAFYGCTNLESITIPSSVTVMGEAEFAGCNSLKSINVDVNNSAYSSVDGVLFNKERPCFCIIHTEDHTLNMRFQMVLLLSLSSHSQTVRV